MTTWKCEECGSTFPSHIDEWSYCPQCGNDPFETFTRLDSGRGGGDE